MTCNSWLQYACPIYFDSLTSPYIFSLVLFEAFVMYLILHLIGCDVMEHTFPHPPATSFRSTSLSDAFKQIQEPRVMTRAGKVDTPALWFTWWRDRKAILIVWKWQQLILCFVWCHVPVSSFFISIYILEEITLTVHSLLLGKVHRDVGVGSQGALCPIVHPTRVLSFLYKYFCNNY
jgi:hypothetical protein